MANIELTADKVKTLVQPVDAEEVLVFQSEDDVMPFDEDETPEAA